MTTDILQLEDVVERLPHKPLAFVLAEKDEGAIEEISGMTEVTQAGGRARYVPPHGGKDHIFDSVICAFIAVREREGVLASEYEPHADLSELGWAEYGGGDWTPPWET